MGYCSQSNFAEVELYNGFNNKLKTRKSKRNFLSKSKSPVIKINVSVSPELSPEEKNLIDEICQSDGVYFKPRKVKTAEFKAKEPWHFIFEDLIHYQGWLYSNRLANDDAFDINELCEGVI